MAPGLFVYGSLMSFRVLETLIFRVPKILPAYIPGRTRLALKNQVYPGLVDSRKLSLAHFPGEYQEQAKPHLDTKASTDKFTKISHTNHHINKTQGIVLKNLSDHEMDLIDYFEGQEFKKEKIPIIVGYDKNWNVEEAFVYSLEDHLIPQLYNFWDFDTFCKEHIKDYLTMCAETRFEFYKTQKGTPKYKPLLH